MRTYGMFGIIANRILILSLKALKIQFIDGMPWLQYSKGNTAIKIALQKAEIKKTPVFILFGILSPDACLKTVLM